MKHRMLKKLKSFSFNPVRPGLVSQPKASSQSFHTSTFQLAQKNHNLLKIPSNKLSELLKDVQEEGTHANTEEKFTTSINLTDGVLTDKEEKENTSDSEPCSAYTTPMHDHAQLSPHFDPAVEISISTCRPSTVQIKGNSDFTPQPLFKQKATSTCTDMEPEENVKSLLLTDFPDKCPPGGSDSIIFYTTSLRGIRKTFEDCTAIRFLLESFRVLYYERDVSMDLEYRDELWRILDGREIPPRLFIRGRYIGGADEVLSLHEKGMLRNLLHGMPLKTSSFPCVVCAGMRFLLCSSCNGSRKILSEGQNDGLSIRCLDCNENGLVKCSVCSESRVPS